jgi:PAS domain S-box-containing protein
MMVIALVSSFFTLGRLALFSQSPTYFNLPIQSCIFFILISSYLLTCCKQIYSKNIRRNHIFIFTLYLLLPIWFFYVIPDLQKLPRNFQYSSEVESIDNFYDPLLKSYNGETKSRTIFSYQVEKIVNNVLIIKNDFDVRKLSGEKIFSVTRKYGIDQFTQSHLQQYGDHSREGFLFAPPNLHKQDFTYWHVNYDVPARMKFIAEEDISGLKVYRYESNFTADQTKDLTNLPEVGRTRGVNLNVHLTLWVEPQTGYLINYKDETTSYFYDLATGNRIYPWNQFRNTFSAFSIQEKANEAKKLLLSAQLVKEIIPLILFIFTLTWTVLTIFHRFNKIHIAIYLPVIIALLGFTLVFLTYSYFKDFTEKQFQAKFEQDTTLLSSAITTKLESYENLLEGARGLFKAKPELNRKEWKAYVDSLRLGLHYTGIQGIGYSEFVDQSELAQFEQKIQTQGFSDFKVFPKGNRSKYAVVKFLEPFNEKNQKAFGYDMWQDPVRQSAMILARDLNKPVISGKVTLVQEGNTDIQSGFLFYLPLFKKDVSLETQQQRQEAILGYVYSPFRVRDFMETVFPANKPPIDLEIFDGEFDKKTDSAEDHEMYDGDFGTYSGDPNYRPKFEKFVPLHLFEHTWTLRFISLPTYQPLGFEAQLPQLVATVGGIFVLLLVLASFSLSISQLRAIGIADEMTKNLNEKTRELQKFKLAVENASDQIVISDRDGIVLYANLALEKTNGWSPKEAVGKKAGSLWGGLMEKTFYQSMWQIIKGKKQVFQSEVINKKRDDTFYTAMLTIYPILDAQGEVEFFVAIERDITKEKDEKVNLIRQRRKDEALLSSIGEGLIATDSKGIVTLINKSFEELLGWSKKEILGKKMAEVVRLFDQNGKLVKTEDRPLEKAMKKMERISVSNCCYEHKKGYQVPIALTVTPITLDGKFEGVIEVFRDISKEKEIEKAKNEFVSLASHQLRTPLTGINWYLELLTGEHSQNLTKTQKSYLDEILESSQRMSELVTALLNVSRIEMGTFGVVPQPTNIIDLADEVIKELKPIIADKKLTVVQRNDQIPLIAVDPKLFRIVYQNLLTNTMKYTPENGKVFVEHQLLEKVVKIGVIDNGVGIPKEEQAKIFSKMFRADNARQIDQQGTGLGLYIVKSIVNQSGGKIWFESPYPAQNKDRSGTAFFVEIPISGMKSQAGSKALE